MEKEDLTKEKILNSYMRVENHSLNFKLKFLFYFCFFFLGVLNNLGYNLIACGSSSLSEKFGNDNLIALYQL